MAKTELTIDVKAKLDVDRKTAETCLRLVECYVNASGVDIIAHRNEDGEVSLEFESRMNIVLPKVTPATVEAINNIGRKTHHAAAMRGF